MAKNKAKAAAENGHDATSSVQLTESDITEVNRGLEKLRKMLKRAAQMGGSLELETAQRERLSEQRMLLAKALEASGGYVVDGSVMYATRVAVRLRYSELKKLQASEAATGVAANHDATARLERLEQLGRQLGIQLDLIEQTKAEEDEDEEDEEEDSEAELGRV